MSGHDTNCSTRITQGEATRLPGQALRLALPLLRLPPNQAGLYLGLFALLRCACWSLESTMLLSSLSFQMVTAVGVCCHAWCLICSLLLTPFARSGVRGCRQDGVQAVLLQCRPFANEGSRPCTEPASDIAAAVR